MINAGESLPDGVDLTGKFIYHVGPVDPVRDEVVGPAGPTTATRMDGFTDSSSRRPAAGHDWQGGAGFRRSRPLPVTRPFISWRWAARRISSRRPFEHEIVAFEDLGMEAIHEFEVEHARDGCGRLPGESVHVRDRVPGRRRSARFLVEDA